MSWWQEYQGFFVLGAFAALFIIGGVARAWTWRFMQKSADAAASGRGWKDSPDKSVQTILTSMATCVHFPLDVEAAAVLLEPAKPPMFWKHDDRFEWSIRATPDEAVPSTVARLEPDPSGTGSRLALISSWELGGIPTSEPDWRKLRKMALTAATRAGVTATEQPGPRIVRTPLTDVSDLHPAVAARTNHYWAREESASA
ncbi:hypothetical protein ACGGZK_18870 [Agromyces sp. MMS24-K17]|uniref:hypothetical protein n=1 Tax=Agromyces sp. MMS24-K17 TaxID=3372850 RepID=UPI003754375E